MEQYPASIDANDTAVNFLEHIDASAIEYLAFEVAAFQKQTLKDHSQQSMSV